MMAFNWRTDWKRPVLWGTSFAIAGVLSLFLLLVGYEWYTSRPKEWDADALKATSSIAHQMYEIEDSKKAIAWDAGGNPTRYAQTMKGSGFSLAFIVENKTSKDVTLPQDLQFYERETKSQALREIKLSLIHQFVIPAHDRAELTADMDYSCSVTDIDTGVATERDGDQCFRDALGDVSEFVAFDNGSHIRLNLPKPVFYSGTESKSK